MKSFSVVAGPILGLAARPRLRDMRPMACQPRHFFGLKDTEQVKLIEEHIRHRESLASDLSVGNLELASRKKKKAKRGGTSARSNGPTTKVISGTDIVYAWSSTTVNDFPVAGPPEPAGPFEPGRAISASNTLGNIAAYQCNGATKVWVLGYGENRVPAWLAAQEGDPHPDTENLGGYALTVRNPERPSWVKVETIERYCGFSGSSRGRMNT